MVYYSPHLAYFEYKLSIRKVFLKKKSYKKSTQITLKRFHLVQNVNVDV